MSSCVHGTPKFSVLLSVVNSSVRFFVVFVSSQKFQLGKFRELGVTGSGKRTNMRYILLFFVSLSCYRHWQIKDKDAGENSGEY